MANLTLQNISKSFDAVNVLNEININIHDGEFIVLVGPSGCGKSTLLRMIAGLEDVSSGDIYIGKNDVTEKDPKDRDISMVFQSYALYPHLSVERNIAFSLDLRKTPKDIVDKKVKEVAETLGLTALLDRRPKELSGGQRQRVAMGRAIVRKPQVFLFDEPLSNLDAKLRMKMRTEMKSLHNKLKTTTVYVTHDQVEAMTLADRIVALDVGKIQQIGCPLELYDFPANTFIADFIGSPSMNFFDGKVIQQEGRLFVETPKGTKLALADHYQDDLIGVTVRYGIRPEDLSLSGNDLLSSVQVKVNLIEPTGLSQLLHCNLEDTELIYYTMDRPECLSGDDINLTIDLERAHLFDLQTGLRILRNSEK